MNLQKRKFFLTNNVDTVLVNLTDYFHQFYNVNKIESIEEIKIFLRILFYGV